MENKHDNVLITSSWDRDKREFFDILSNIFNKSAIYHKYQKDFWDRISVICTVLTMTLTFSSICIELLVGSTPLSKYSNFCEKISVMIISSFVITASPSKKSRSHDKCRHNYLEMVSRISTQINRDVHARKNFDLLLVEIKNKYDNTVEISHPPEELTFPVGIWTLGQTDINLLGSLHNKEKKYISEPIV